MLGQTARGTGKLFEGSALFATRARRRGCGRPLAGTDHMISRFWLASREQLDFVVYFLPLRRATRAGGEKFRRRRPSNAVAVGRGPPPCGREAEWGTAPHPTMLASLDDHAGGFAVAMRHSRCRFAA